MTDQQDRQTSKVRGHGPAVGPDGIVRTADIQHDINFTLAHVFKGDVGQKALTYLRSITINAVCGPEISDAGLRHREGMRHLVGIIEQRIQDYHREQQRTDPLLSQSGPGRRARRRAAAERSERET